MSRNAECTIRETVLATLDDSRVEADTLDYATGSNVSTASETERGCLIVALKPVKTGGAKGAINQPTSEAKH